MKRDMEKEECEERKTTLPSNRSNGHQVFFFFLFFSISIKKLGFVALNTRAIRGSVALVDLLVRGIEFDGGGRATTVRFIMI